MPFGETPDIDTAGAGGRDEQPNRSDPAGSLQSLVRPYPANPTDTLPLAEILTSTECPNKKRGPLK